MTPKRWTIEIDNARFDKLKSEERFLQLVALSRALNTLRFVQAALLAHPEESDSLQGKNARSSTRFSSPVRCYTKPSSWSSVCASISAKFLSLARSNISSKDPTATDLRNSNLNPLRNQLRFHFFENRGTTHQE